MGGTAGLLDALGIGVREGGGCGEVAVIGRDEGGGLAEAGGLVAGDAVGEVEDADAAAEDGFRDETGGPGEADPGGEVSFFGGVDAVVAAGGEEGSAVDFELGSGDFGLGVGGVGGDGTDGDGAGGRAIEAVDGAVVAFGGGGFAFEAESEVEGEVGGDAEIVLEEEGVIVVFVLTPSVDVVLAAGRHAEEEGGEVLSDGGGGGVIERAIGPVIAEGEGSVGVTGA